MEKGETIGGRINFCVGQPLTASTFAPQPLDFLVSNTLKL